MPSEIIIFSVGVFLAEDAFNFVVQHSANLGRMFKQYLTSCKPSVVRRIGSYLTWIHGQRLHILWRDEFNNKISSCSENVELRIHESPDQDVTNSMELEAKMEEMQKELLNLQTQITKLLMNQEKRLFVDEVSEEKLGPENKVSSTTNLMPPPPPPPMPSTPLVKPSSVVVKVKKVNHPDTRDKSANSIIEELSKRPPKLRHVELTPGGRPVRRHPVSDNPSDILLAVLKKRFDALHSP